MGCSVLQPEALAVDSGGFAPSAPTPGPPPVIEPVEATCARPPGGRGAVLPQETFADYDRCRAAIEAGAASCQLVPSGDSVFGVRGSHVLVLGHPLPGWFVEVRSRWGVHVIRLFDPSNRLRFRLGRVAASQGCAEDSELGGYFLRDEPDFAAESGLLLSAQALPGGAVLELVLLEIFTGCGDCGCACGNPYAFERDEPLRLRIPRQVGRLGAR